MGTSGKLSVMSIRFDLSAHGAQPIIERMHSTTVRITMHKHWQAFCAAHAPSNMHVVHAMTCASSCALAFKKG